MTTACKTMRRKKEDEPYLHILKQAAEYGGYVKKHIFYGMSLPNARALQAWCMVHGYECSEPTRLGDTWSCTIQVPYCKSK